MRLDEIRRDMTRLDYYTLDLIQDDSVRPGSPRLEIVRLPLIGERQQRPRGGKHVFFGCQVQVVWETT